MSSFFDDIVSAEEEKVPAKKTTTAFYEIIPVAFYLNLYGTTSKTKLGITTKDTKVEVQPSSIGVPKSDTEQDLMIYLAKHIPRDKNKKPVSKKVFFTKHDFLKVTKKQTSGRGYMLLEDSLRRLTETHYTIESTKYTDSRNNPINFKGSLLEDYNWEDSYVVFSDFLYDQLIKVHKNPAKLTDDYFSRKRSSTLGKKMCQFATLYRYQMPVGPPRKFTLKSVFYAINPRMANLSKHNLKVFKWSLKNSKIHIPGFDVNLLLEEDKIIFKKKKVVEKNKLKTPKKARRMFTAKTAPEKLCWQNHTRSFRRLLVQNNLHHLLHLNQHEYMNYTLDEAIKHIESKFKPGMSWQNYGPDGWHFDHIRPLSSYKIKGEKDRRLRKALQLENLQPLWSEENHSKGSKC